MTWLAALTAVVSGLLWFWVRRRADARTESHTNDNMLPTAAALILSAATIVLVVLSFSHR